MLGTFLLVVRTPAIIGELLPVRREKAVCVHFGEYLVWKQCRVQAMATTLGSDYPSVQRLMRTWDVCCHCWICSQMLKWRTHLVLCWTRPQMSCRPSLALWVK